MTLPLLHDEKHLLQRLRMGSEEAFSEIYGLYWEKLFFVAHKRLQSAEDAKEVIQDVFLTLWQKREQLSINSLPLYLSAMTRYAVYRLAANQKRNTAHMKVVEQRSPQQSPAIDLDNKQMLDLLVQLSNELPEKHRLVFLHHKMLDRPLEEVADMLGVSVRTAEGYSAKVMDFMRRHKHQMILSILLFWRL